MKRKDYNPGSTAVLCSEHFDPEKDYECNVHGNKVLRKGSIPSVFNFPLNVGSSKTKVRRPLLLRREREGNITNFYILAVNS